MNYSKLYDSICNNAKLLQSERLEFKKSRIEYYENHHIIPRCMNGNDSPENLVTLTAKEHFLVHKILTKIYPENRKLQYAYWMMCMSISKNTVGRIRPSAKEYQNLRDNLVPWNKGLTGIYSDETRRKISEGLKGTKHTRSVEYRKKHSDRQKGVPKKKIECPHCHKIAYLGKNHIDYCIYNPNAVQRETIACPHCNKVGTSKYNMETYHFDNCLVKTGKLSGIRLKISLTKNKNKYAILS